MAKQALSALFLELCEDSSSSSSEDELDIQIAVAASNLKSAKQPRHRQHNYVKDVVSSFRLDEFKTFFRVSRSTLQILQDKICELCREEHITGIMNREGSGGSVQVDLGDRLLIFLWYMASKDKYVSIADRFGISESTASYAIRNLLAFIQQHFVEKVIVWPTRNELQELQDMYLNLKNFPGVCGMKDGTHIQIRRPSVRGVDYYNRKDFYSIILQAVVAEDMRFTSVFAGFPGKVHDARVFRRSPIYERGLELCGCGHLLGDSAYPNISWLLTPYRDNGQLTQTQRHYNEVHSSIRSTVERAFGLLKGRFARLQYIDQRQIATVVQTVLSGCFT